MAHQPLPNSLLAPTTLLTTRRYDSSPTATSTTIRFGLQWGQSAPWQDSPVPGGTTGRGILIGLLSAMGSALFIIIIIAIILLLRYTSRGRIFLDRMGRPGEYDDEQAFAKEEAEALEDMDDIQRAEYMRAKAFVQGNPPESIQTDISLSQFLAIQEKGVSAWELEPELEVANCFVEARTEIEFFDSECSVQSNLPMPKQNDVYYWEAKIYDKPESTTIAIGVTTKPYPLFRLPGYHKTSIAYLSPGHRRFNQPFTPLTNYGPPYVRGDVVGVGYRPRTGTIFFTRNGKKLDEVSHSLKNQNFFPTVGATGPCSVHVNFGQSAFVFIEANVKKWGLAPATGSLAPPPPYGSEAGSILLEGGQHSVQEGQGWLSASHGHGHTRTRSGQLRSTRQAPTSPGPTRSPTDISLAQLSLVDSVDYQDDDDDDAGEGTSGSVPADSAATTEATTKYLDEAPPPDYESPPEEEQAQQRGRRRARSNNDTSAHVTTMQSHNTIGLGLSTAEDPEREALIRQDSPPIPSYDAAVRGTNDGQTRRDH